MLILACGNTYTSDDFVQGLHDIFFSEGEDFQKIKAKVEVMFTGAIQEKRDILAQKGSQSKSDNPELFDLLASATKDADMYFKGQGSQEEQYAASENLVKTVFGYRMKELQEQEEAKNFRKSAIVTNYINSMKNLSPQQAAVKSPQVEPKIVITTTREQRRDAQKAAAKLEKKAAKASQNK